MRNRQILGLLIAVAALAAFAGGASATTPTAPSGTVYTGNFHFANENGHVSLHNPAANLECSMTIAGSIAKHGAGVTAESSITTWTWTGCTGGWTWTTNSGGTFITHAVGSGNDTVTSTGATWTAVNDSLGITCRYATNATDLGTLTAAPTSTGHATLDLSASIPFHSGSVFCGSGASSLTGFLKLTSPTGFSVS